MGKWNSMVLQVELATGEFPYKDCKTDFEVLTKVLQDDPPLLTPGPAYSHELCSFIRDWLVIAFIYIVHCGVFLLWKNSSILGEFNRASAHGRLSKGERVYVIYGQGHEILTKIIAMVTEVVFPFLTFVSFAKWCINIFIVNTVKVSYILFYHCLTCFWNTAFLL